MWYLDLPICVMADSVRGESVDKSEPQSDEPSELKADARRRGKSILQDARAAQSRTEEAANLTFPSAGPAAARSPLPELKGNEVVGTVIAIYLEAGKYALR
jgi:hypothetical protein